MSVTPSQPFPLDDVILTARALLGILTSSRRSGVLQPGEGSRAQLPLLPCVHRIFASSRSFSPWAVIPNEAVFQAERGILRAASPPLGIHALVYRGHSCPRIVGSGKDWKGTASAVPHRISLAF